MQIEEYGEKFASPFLKKALKIHSDTRRFMSDFLKDRGFLELPPVIISSVTDPLNHPTNRSQVEVYGYMYELTKSMIFHKQLALHIADKINQIYTRIAKKNQKPEQFKWYIEFGKKFGFPKSAGFGIGIERFVRFITGAKRIEDVTPFPKGIGEFFPL